MVNMINGLISIELHAPTSSTQKLKLMGRGGQFTLYANNKHTWCLGHRAM